MPLADFAKLFGPNGAFDRFFGQYLASRVDRSRPQWTWRVDDTMARGMSAATLREFQRAAEIREAFFSTGGTMPAVTFSVTPLTLTGDAGQAKLDVNGTSWSCREGGTHSRLRAMAGPGGAGPDGAADRWHAKLLRHLERAEHGHREDRGLVLIPPARFPAPC